MNKYKLMDKVQLSALTNQQKQLLCYLILRSDDKGRSFPSVARLCQVAGITHEKNFKGVTHYLPGLVTVERVGRKNNYVLNTPAVEGLSEKVIVLKQTTDRLNTPADEGVSEVEEVSNTPALADDTPATEGVNTPAPADNTPSTEGTDSSKDSSVDSSKERTETSQAQSSFVSEVGGKTGMGSLKERAEAVLFELDPAAPGLSRDELGQVYDLTNDKPWGRLPLNEAVTRVFADRGKGFSEW